MFDKEPREWHNSRYAFLNPEFMNGVLIEIIDGAPNKPESRSADDTDIHR